MGSLLSGYMSIQDSYALIEGGVANLAYCRVLVRVLRVQSWVSVPPDCSIFTANVAPSAFYSG